MSDDVVVKFGAQISEVERAVQNIEKQLQHLNGSVSNASNSLGNLTKGLIAAISVQQLGGIVTALGDMGEKAERTSEMLGMTVEQVTALQYATIITGQGADQMTSIMERLARTMDAAASGGKQQVAAFKEVGVSFQDANGKLRPLQDMLYDIADRFAGAKDGAEKTALAMELMGRSGAEAIPLLNGGSKALRQFAEEGRRAGVVLTADMARGMGETGDKIDNLGQSLSGLAIKIFQQLKPAIDAAVDGMTAFVQSIDSGSIAAGLNAILDVVISVMTAVAEMAAFVQKVLNDVGTRAMYVQQLGLKAFSSNIAAVMKQQIETMNAETDAGLKANIAMFGAWKAQVQALIGGGKNSSGSPDDRDGGGTVPGGFKLPTFTPPAGPASPGANAVQGAIDQLQKLTLSLQDQIATLNMSTAAATAYTEEHKVLAIAQINNIKLTATQQRELKKYAQQAGEAKAELQQMAAVQDTMRGIAEGIAGAFESWLNGTDSLWGALLKMTLQLAAAVAEALLLNLILSAMGLTLPTTGLGAVFAPLFGGGKAEGGPMEPGQWYMAGEKGPEPVWTGGNGAFAAGYSGNNGGSGPSAKEIASEIAKSLVPTLRQQSYSTRRVSQTIQDIVRGTVR